MTLGDNVYLSRRNSDYGAEISTYDAPFKITTRLNYFTCMPMKSNGFRAIAQYGEKVDKMWNCQCNAKTFANLIHEGDLMWVDNVVPNAEIESQYGNGASANAIVKSVIINNIGMQVILEDNPNRILR